MGRQVEQERRLAALSAFIAQYEHEHGEITAADMAQAVRDAKRTATVVGGTKSRSRQR